MHLSLDEFCDVVKGLNRTQADKALALLWFHDRKQENIAMTAGALSRIISDHHIGNPHSTQLAELIRKTRLASENKSGFYLKPGSRKLIHDWFAADLDGIQPKMDHSTGYLPEAIWRNTRGYIESVCRQLNGCFKFAYYDAAAVMLRRLLETLIIEAYEHLNREAEIQNGAGEYFMLKDLVIRTCGENQHAGLHLGRSSKAGLKEAREIGNQSAHNRRYNAVAADLTKLQSGVRLVVQELLHIANLAKTS